MRATIEIEEYQYAVGLFKRSPRWRVNCKIIFSEEELAIIRARSLYDLHVYTQLSPMNDETPVFLKEIIKHGIWSVFASPIEARNFEHELSTDILPSLKNYIAECAESNYEPQTLEF